RRSIDAPRRRVLAHGQRCRVPDRVAVREALRGHARRCHRLVLRGQATAGDEQRSAVPRYEAFIGNLVIIVDEPREPWTRTGVQLDRPGGAGDRARKLAAGDHIVVRQRTHADDLPALPNADLHAGIVDEASLATGEVVAEEARVLAHLPASLDLGFGEIACTQRIQLASVGSHHARAVAEQLTGTRRRKQEYLRAGQTV